MVSSSYAFDKRVRDLLSKVKRVKLRLNDSDAVRNQHKITQYAVDSSVFFGWSFIIPYAV